MDACGAVLFMCVIEDEKYGWIKKVLLHLRVETAQGGGGANLGLSKKAC